MVFMRYYSGTFYGRSAAAVLYELSTQMNKDDPELLWLYMVGL